MARTPKYKTADELDKKIQEYFDTCEIPGSVITITGLIHHCGFCSRQTFYDLEKNEKFSYTIKRARIRVEEHYEKLLQRNGSVAGAIFALKNLGWADTQQIDHTTGGEKLSLNVIVDKGETADTLKKLMDGSKAH